MVEEERVSILCSGPIYALNPFIFLTHTNLSHAGSKPMHSALDGMHRSVGMSITIYEVCHMYEDIPAEMTFSLISATVIAASTGLVFL